MDFIMIFVYPYFDVKDEIEMIEFF